MHSSITHYRKVHWEIWKKLEVSGRFSFCHSQNEDEEFLSVSFVYIILSTDILGARVKKIDKHLESLEISFRQTFFVGLKQIIFVID